METRLNSNRVARLSIALLLIAGLRVSAQTVLQWANTGTDFGTPSNWIEDTAPANSLTANIADFATAIPTAQPNLATSQSVAGLEFGSGAGAFTLSGAGTLTLGTSGIDDQSSATQTISTDLALGAATTFTSAGTLNISGTIATGGFALGLGTGTGTVSGAISGTGSVTVAGASDSTWTLSAANSYSGGTVIRNGTLNLGASGTLPSTGSVVINDNVSAGAATLQLANGVNQTIGPLTFGGAGGTADSQNAVSLSGTSTLTLGGTVTFNATGNPLGAEISGGTLALGGNRIFEVDHSTAGTNDLTVDAVISGTGDTLTKIGSGNLALSGTNTYSGGTVVEDGTVTVYSNGSLLSTGDLTINATAASGTAIFVLGTGTNQTIGNLTLGGSGGGSNAANLVEIGTSSTLTVGGNVTYNAGTNPATGQITGGTLALGANTTFNVGHSTHSGSSDLLVSSVITGSGSVLTKTGSGSLLLSGDNTYSGGTTVSGGQLILGSATAAGTGAMDIQSGATLRGTGTVAGLATIESGGSVSPGTTGSPGTLTFSGGLTLNSGSAYNFQLRTSSDKLVVTAGALTGPGAAGTLTINLSNSGGFTAGTYALIDFSSDTTTPTGFNAADFALGSTIAGYSYSLSVNGDVLDVTALSAVPEPSTYATIVGAGALGFAVWRRRRGFANIGHSLRAG